MPMNSTAGQRYHEPVLVGRVIDLLRSAKTVLDGTLGGGGHAEALLRSGVERVIGVDRDPEALAAATARLEHFHDAGRFLAVQANYADALEQPALLQMEFEGVLLDLGVSSRQLDEQGRGFTFREGAPLDMRMGAEPADRTAATILNEWDERALAAMFREYGDEPPPRAARLAREVARRRARAPFATSDDLVRAIRAVLGPRSGPPDFARLFQAVRIEVNQELAGLAQALPALRDRMAAGGVMVVITYHSGEDRLVKHAFRDWSTACTCPPRQLRCTCGGRARGTTLTRKAVLADAEERERNPRARSAKLRAWRKAGEGDGGDR
jgi:16S rRNA (cytosine1402-N4)-methyltransferase